MNGKSRVRFNDVGDPSIVPYDGTPFIILARCEQYCIYGRDKHQKKKRIQKENRESLLQVMASCEWRDAQCATDNLSVILWDLWNAIVRRDPGTTI